MKIGGKKEELVGKRCPREVELVTRRLSGVIVEAFSRADINVATRQAVVLVAFCYSLAHSRSSRDACIIMKKLA